MKVSVELNVSDKEFYDVMMKSLQEELNHVSKKKLELKEGLKYKKKSAQRKGIGSEITVYIKKLVPNELYVATFNTAIDHTVISYKIDALNESKIKVTYEEVYENVSSQNVPVWKQKMAEKQSSKKAKKMFKEIEKFILNERSKQSRLFHKRNQVFHLGFFFSMNAL